MKKIFTLALLCLPLLMSHGQGTVQVSKWRHNAKGAFTFDSDDYARTWYGDIALISSMLDTMPGVKMTFATNPGGALASFWNTCNTKLVGNDFVCHSFDHEPYGSETFYKEVDSAIKIMDDVIPWQKCLCFVYPGGGAYSRLDLNNYIKTRRMIGTNYGSGANPNSSTVDPFNATMLYYLDNTAPLKKIVDNAITGGGWGLIGSHQLGGAGGWGPMPADTFKYFMNYCWSKVKTNDIWMSGMTNVIKYMMERQKFPVTVKSENDTMMVLHIDTKTNEINPSAYVDNSYYDEPLTLTGTTKFGTAYNVDANPQLGDVTIKYNNSSVTRITQGRVQLLPASTLTIDKTYQEVSADSTEITISVTASPKAVINASVPWITLSVDSVKGSLSIKLKVKMNILQKDRSGCVFFTCNGSDYKRFILKQAKSTKFLDIFQSALSVKYNAVSSSVTISSNIAWTATSTVSWLVPKTVSGSGTIALALTVTPNPDTLIRKGWIKVANTDGYKDSVLVTQEAAPAVGPGLIGTIDNLVKFWPNPVISSATIDLSSVDASLIEILTLQGTVIRSFIPADQELSVDLSDLAPGTYFLRIYNTSGLSCTKKLIRQ